MWKVVIEKLDNGFKVDFKNGTDNFSSVYQEKSFQIEEDKEHIVEMLYDILDFFGEVGSKHDKKRLTVEYKNNTE